MRCCLSFFNLLYFFGRETWVGAEEGNEDGFAVVDGFGRVDLGGRV